MDFTEWRDPTVTFQMSRDQMAPFLRHLIGEKTDAVDDEIRRIGLIVDLADELSDLDALRDAVSAASSLLPKVTAPEHRSVIHYFISNSVAAISHHTVSKDQRGAWQRAELGTVILHLRTAVRLASNSDSIRLSQMYTNLGNALSECGRIIEAVAAWDRALTIIPNFSMAIGNRGYGLVRYAMLAHDPGHQGYLLREAHRALGEALSERTSSLDDSVRRFFTQIRADIERRVPSRLLSNRPSNREHPIGRSRKERAYRTWCLENRLFINELNDVDAGSIAAIDVLTLPSLTTSLDARPPTILRFFNQLKQEYASARYLFYEATQLSFKAHFSDRNVRLVNTLDYSLFGLATETTKFAYRSAYSLFDKVAYLLNDYFRLDIPERQVSFRTLWYDGRQERRLRSELSEHNNPGLRALYWLAKDLYEADPAFSAAIEPDAQQLAAIRNHLEHKYLSLHDEFIVDSLEENAEGFRAALDRSDFEAKTLRLLQLARSAIVYVVQAVHAEEGLRNSKAPRRLAVPMLLPLYEDHWKR